jgi:DNA sulfur modification protein DndB
MSTPWHTPSLRGVLGDWVFYPSLMSAAQMSKNVMPSKEIRESKHLDDYLQRDLKPRVKKIVRYLKTRDTRFFNAILLGVFDALPNWVEFDLKVVAQKLDLGDVSAAQSSMGLLTFTGAEKIFAIDGQHRTEAIRQGHADFGERLKADQYPVIFLAHLDTKEGKVRTRRLFCDINKNAVSVSKGDKVVIDEDELPAIVTRRLYAEYPRFKKGKEIAVTEKIELVSKGGKEYFTSLLAVFTVCQKLKKLYHKPRGTLESSIENVIAFKKLAIDFFEYVIEREPALRRYFIMRKTTPKAERKGNRNLVFRPIGLELLARLYVHFHLRKRLPVFDWALKNLRWQNPGGVWDGTVWQHKKIQPKPKTAALNFVLYLLHELPDSKAPALLNDLREYRNDDAYELPKRANIPSKLLKANDEPDA